MFHYIKVLPVNLGMYLVGKQKQKQKKPSLLI